MTKTTKTKINAALASAVAFALLTSCGTAIEKTDNRLIPSPAYDDSYSAQKPDLSDMIASENSATDDSAAVGVNGDNNSSDKATDESEQTGDENQASQTDKTGTASAHILCVGDNLIHDNIYTEALELGGGETYDFSSMYELIQPYVENADVAILNQETLVNDLYEPCSYPTFSTPLALGDEVIDLGFNVISMSNNHVLDNGSAGLINSLDYWDSKGVTHYGAYRDEADSEDIRTLEVNGITFAFLGYMEHTNGISLDENGDGKVVYLSDEETIERQVREADEIADVVVVSCHFGTEVEHELNTQQQDMAPKLVEWGADLIVGTQAHCVNTCEYLDKPDGGQAFVYYGLGNFFHTMYDSCSAAGIMGDLDVTVDFNTGEVTFENVKAIPIISHYEADSYDSMWCNCKIYPLAQYTDELFAKNFNDGVTRDSVMECLQYIPDEFLSIE